MADISKITLPNGSSYNIKDATARVELEGKAAASHTHVKSEVGLGNVDNTADTDKNVKSATKLQTYKQGSTTSTYGDQYPLYAQWETNSILKLVCSGYTVKTDYATSAGNADTVDSKHASDFAAASHTHTKSQITDFPTIPTKTSQLTNDSGFKTTDNNTTYSLSKSGSTITLTGSDGKTTSVTDSDTTYTLPTATSSTLGGVKTGSNITNSRGTISLTKANVTAALGYTPPTTNTTYDVATQSANGLMSSSDKTKLDGIATGANKTTVDSALSSTSTNPVQNKVINSALAGKAAASHTHTTQSAEATNDANASYLRQIATGTAEATTSNCPNGCLYGQYS